MPTPYFIDATGTRCAMAHVLEAAGAVELVRRVAATANNARIADVAFDGELRHWLAVAGLTLGEAARVQPTYCGMYKKGDCICRSYDHASDWEVQVATATIVGDADAGTVPARIDTVLGGVAISAPGDSIAVIAPRMPHTNVLLEVVRTSDGVVGGRIVPADDEGPYVYCAAANTIPIDRSDVVSALLSSDCLTALGATDPRFLDSTCDPTADAGTDARTDATTTDASLDSGGDAHHEEVGDGAGGNPTSQPSSGCAVATRPVIGDGSILLVSLAAIYVARSSVRRLRSRDR